MKHSKYRNTGLLFELLVRKITNDILNNNKSEIAEKILRNSFNKKSELFKENKFFNVLIENKVKTTDQAKDLIENTIKAYNKLINVKQLNKEKYVRNPKTNEKLFKKESYKLHFKISKNLHKRLNSEKKDEDK